MAYFSTNDLYPGATNNFSTAEETVPIEEQSYIDNTTDGSGGVTSVTTPNKKYIFGSVILMAGLLILISFFDKTPIKAELEG